MSGKVGRRRLSGKVGRRPLRLCRHRKVVKEDDSMESREIHVPPYRTSSHQLEFRAESQKTPRDCLFNGLTT
jgi:hypothetical protein